MSLLEEKRLELKAFLDNIIEEAKKKKLNIVVGASDMFSNSSVCFTGPMTVLHGLSETIELEVRCLHIDHIQQRRRNERKNNQSVGAGDSQLRGNEGMVGTPENLS